MEDKINFVRKNSGNIKNVVLENKEKNDLGWEMGLNEFIEHKMKDIINPIENYETIKYIHGLYDLTIGGHPLKQRDIFYHFHFIDPDGGYTQDYNVIGLTYMENSMLLRETKKSFFKLEFYKTKNNESPTKYNRILVSSKMISIPLGEKTFFDPINDTIHSPVFRGGSVKNTEIMNFYWFEDESNIISDEYTGDTFWMYGKFYNSDNGDILGFSTIENETPTEDDLYYQLKLYTNGTYEITNNGERIGTKDNPIKFFEKV